MRWMAGMARERLFEAYGVACAVSSSSDDLAEIAESVVPPLAAEVDPARATANFELDWREGSIAVLVDGALLGATPDPDVAAGILDSAIRARIALRAPGRIFVHAGVVAAAGRAIVIPGPSFSGKTTLVAALLERGATYLSDEFAVLDGSGVVHPYPRALWVRAAGARDGRPLAAAADRFPVAAGPLPVGLIAVTSYRPGARWEPARRSRGEGALALLANTVPARERSAESLRAVRAAAARAQVVEGERGEAGEAAPLLLAAVRDAAPVA